eukprot:jgi/Bigna1/60541/fgenesh1_kg.12_\
MSNDLITMDTVKHQMIQHVRRTELESLLSTSMQHALASSHVSPTVCMHTSKWDHLSWTFCILNSNTTEKFVKRAQCDLVMEMPKSVHHHSFEFCAHLTPTVVTEKLTRQRQSVTVRAV